MKDRIKAHTAIIFIELMVGDQTKMGLDSVLLKEDKMLKYVIDYLSSEVHPKIYYLNQNGEFTKKPYRYFDGDESYPDYYHAKWHDLNKLFEVLESLPILKNYKNEVIRYRIVALHIKFETKGQTKIPTWNSKVIGPW